MTFKSRWKELGQIRREIMGLLNDRRDYQRQPENEFTLQGCQVIPSFLDKEECDRLIQMADCYLRSHSYSITGNCYLVNRKDLKIQAADMQVRQIVNAQEVDDKLSQLFHSQVIEELFEQSMGEKLRLRSITIKIDDPDTQTKRGFHTDGVTPPTYKAFIYLNDVDDYGDGPYTVIPGSHRHTLRRITNYLYSQALAVFSRPTTYEQKEDIKLFYSDQQAVPIFAKAGTLILSNQQLVHKGWHNHDRKRRYALVCYLVSKKHDPGYDFNLYRYTAITQAGLNEEAIKV